jgi:hypothetical protein
MMDMQSAIRHALIRNAAEMFITDMVERADFRVDPTAAHTVARFISAATGLDSSDPDVVWRTRNAIMTRVRQLTRPAKPRRTTAYKAPGGGSS